MTTHIKFHDVKAIKITQAMVITDSVSTIDIRITHEDDHGNLIEDKIETFYNTADKVKIEIENLEKQHAVDETNLRVEKMISRNINKRERLIDILDRQIRGNYGYDVI